ncbi:hypothetical protein [Blastococcus haudaquaticus]|uniref:META domain-containing protein n=1 Tax=Blastococcus haudaquaticus TaxID=1938745 RepID=A0A286GUF5_9ACTN|nr:hypothetical protein [Blastococcus haudaquaticus]SOD99102.1 hypothetical protein SAMN06272739_2168 [Blastococcus haudaquaticus]
MTDRRYAVPVAAALALCACAGPAGDPPPVGLPGPTTGVEQTFEVAPLPPPVTWGDDGDLAVTTYGSSSCPSGPTTVTVVGEQEIRIEIEPLFPDRDPCTADMAPRTTAVDRPEGVRADDDLTVRLVYSREAEETVVLPPAGD